MRGSADPKASSLHSQEIIDIIKDRTFLRGGDGLEKRMEVSHLGTVQFEVTWVACWRYLASFEM